MYNFTYHRASGLRQATNMLGKFEEAKLLAGGQTLLPTMKLRLASPSHIIDLNKIEGLDGIEDTAHRLVSYGIDPVPRDMIELANIVNACAIAAKSAFEALEHKGPILEHCIEINRLENEADLISRAAVADLFHKQKDPITLIKLKEVYEFFENTIDRFEDVADVLQSVAVKNS